MVRIILILALLSVSCSKGPEDTGIEIFPDMVHSVAVEAFSSNKLNEKNSKPSMRQPVKGSIPRGKMPFNYGPGTAEAKRAGLELQNPFKNSKDLVSRGKQSYENYCLVCHGKTGEGDGPIIPKFPNPPSFHTKRIKKYSDGRFYHIITRGSGDMPEHATQIPNDDRWFLIHYIKELQGRN